LFLVNDYFILDRSVISMVSVAIGCGGPMVARSVALFGFMGRLLSICWDGGPWHHSAGTDFQRYL
jgi:hypothetical protein